ncbi:ABC-type transport system, involved in lipoprotein release, permease component [Gottschalkia purinilytica]|uniref:ABC-type transport system, involved in lipoprotein release, permease component n=1 Tax=Gottschalkia purinilytica TaxID=1503 RepID=A0A0L0WDK5_GOTPU|nr:ABC transporter permease [Gottschalkia purinilytica]KNF09558.1 ABC-type transport system, involved in lipoprotein release, permease component [Gottschalkia purinilytica]
MLTYIKIAWKYIIKYSKRSFAMVLAITLSSFLIITIGSMNESSKVININTAKKIDGAQHVTYGGINLNQVEKVKSNRNVKRISNTVYYNGWNDKNQLLVNMIAADSNILYMEATKMKEGRFPTKSNEIAIEEWVLDRLELKHELGQTIEIPLKEGKKIKQFKLSGIIKDRMDEKSTGTLEAFVAFNKERLLGKENSINLLVEFKDGVKTRNEIKKLAKGLNIKEEKHLTLNKELLQAMGQLDNTDWELVKISSTLMLIGGMVIYSLYSISVLKRMQEYGIIRAIGSTSSQIAYIIILEIVIIYIIGILIGTILGVSAMYMLKGSTIDLFYTGKIKLDTIVIPSFAVRLSMITTLASILLAGIRAIVLSVRVSPIEAINKNTQDSKIFFNDKESFIDRLLSISKRISFKNIKRNKKTFVFTILAMCIGCTIFLTTTFRYSFFGRDLEYRMNTFFGTKYDFEVNVNGTSPMKIGYNEKQIKNLRELPEISEVIATQIIENNIKIDKKYINGEYGSNYLEYMEGYRYVPQIGGFSLEKDNDKQLVLRSNTFGLSDKGLNKLRKSLIKGKIDINKMNEENVAIIYIPESKKSKDPNDENMQPVFNIDVGDKISLSIPKESYDDLTDSFQILSNYEQYKSKYVDKEFTIIGIVDNIPIDNYMSLGNTPDAIISKNIFRKITDIDIYRYLEIDMKEGADYKTVRNKVYKLSDTIPGTYFQDNFEKNKEIMNSGNQRQILEYGVILVLILISGLSIFNNINYNLASRIREYGVLKAVGLTEKQFRRMISFEGLMYGGISAAVSCIVGFISQLTFYLYYAYCEDAVSIKGFFIEFKPYLIVILLNLFIGYIATLEPTRQVNKIEITEAIRSVE